MEEDKNLNQTPVQSPSPEQTQSVVPPVPQTNKPKFKLPILLVAALVLLIAIGTASAAFIFLPKSSTKQEKQTEVAITPQPTTPQATTIPSSTQTLDSTAKWKIYTGKNFNFKYPSTWLTDNNQIYDPSTMFKGGNGGGVVMYKTQLWFTEVDSKQTLEQYITQYYGNQTGFKMNDITVNGLKAKSFYNPIGEGTFGWYIAFSSGSNIFLFGPKDEEINQNQIFNQILSTFKFTN